MNELNELMVCLIFPIHAFLIVMGGWTVAMEAPKRKVWGFISILVAYILLYIMFRLGGIKS